MAFTQESFRHEVSPQAIDVCNAIWQRLAQAGTWWNAPQKIAIAQIVRTARPRDMFNRERPNPIEISNEAEADQISDLVVDTVERIVTEPGNLSREWCRSVCKILGEGAYVELVAISILVLPIDRFCLYLGRDLEPFPEAEAGEPSREERDDLIDIGGWVKITQEAKNDQQLVNVSRAVSQCPIENVLRRQLVDAFYMEGHSFFEAVWENKTLSRPQLELAATRTSEINKCFYCAQGHTVILDIASKSLGEKASLEAAQGHGDGKDIGVPDGETILEWTEIANRTPEKAHDMFPRLQEILGKRGAIELAATVAIFNGLNRTSDPTGMPLEEVMMAYGRFGNHAKNLHVSQFNGAGNSQSLSLLKAMFILLKFRLRKLFLRAGQ